MVRGIKINGEVLERKIAEAYMSKALFARTIGVSRPTVTSWIYGDRKPNPEMVPKMAKVLKCKPQELVIREEGTR
jgi:plasmid maintenance system antidote protein VapI